jgi:hypothetical protein
MNKWMVALMTGALMTVAATAADAPKGDDMLSHLVLGASADSWNVWNATAAVRDDAGVQAGKATRVTAKKGANSWDAQASVTLQQPVQKGDVLLVAYYARVETPPAGATTANIPSAGLGLNKAPYTGLTSEAAAPTSKWAVYYSSGVADDDHAKGSLNFGVQLAAADQVIDLGPVFIFNFGPSYDRTKLPHNKIAAAAAPAAPVAAAPQTPEGVYAADLAKIRGKLPVKGVLINADPGAIFAYGPDTTAQSVTAADVTGGKFTRTVTAKPGTNSWDDGVSAPVTGTIKKGDVVFAAVLVRATEPAPGAQTGLIAELGVHLSGAPYTAIATASATVPKGQWTWIFASGVATADYASGTVGFGMQLGASKQTLDIGPVFVLNLGPGIDTAKLPNNFGKPL